MIHIIAIGKKHEDWVRTGIERYQKRLQLPFNIEWILLSHSSFGEQRARDEESEHILKRLMPNDYVILLDERGTKVTSIQFLDIIEQRFVYSQNIILVIGGAYGVNNTLHERADRVISISDMVLPHQLVRLLLVEQIYRAQEIWRGNKYHHI